MTIIKKLIRRKRKTVDPTDFQYVGSHEDVGTNIQYFLFDKQSIQENPDLKDINKLHDYPKTDKKFWLNVHGLHDPKLISNICRQLGMHRIFIHEILDTNHISRIQEMNDFILFTVKSNVYRADNKLVVEQISFILGKNFLYTFQERKGDHFEHIRTRLREDIGLTREKGTDYLLFLLLEAILDNYESVIEEIEERIKNFTMITPDDNLGSNFLFEITNLKNELNNVLKNISPIIDALTKLEINYPKIIDESNRIYFSNLKNSCIHITEHIAFYLQKLESSTNIFFSYQDQKMNQIMKILTIVSTIFIPLTFIAGVYGMNFENMPELRWQNGYFFSLGVMFAIFIIMILYFKRKKWF